MFWNHQNSKTERRTNDTDSTSLLSQWELAVTSNGLVVRPNGSELTPQGLAPLARRLRLFASSQDPQRVTFDLSNVRHFGPQWTIVLAMLLDLSRTLNGAVTLSGLQGQPAAVVSLYLNNQSYRRLFAA